MSEKVDRSKQQLKSEINHITDKYLGLEYWRIVKLSLTQSYTRSRYRYRIKHLKDNTFESKLSHHMFNDQMNTINDTHMTYYTYLNHLLHVLKAIRDIWHNLRTDYQLKIDIEDGDQIIFA